MTLSSRLLIFGLLLVVGCKKEETDYKIDVVVSNFRAESVRIVVTDTLENIVYYDKWLVDDDRSSSVNVVSDSFFVPKGIPKFLYKIQLMGSKGSISTVNFNHRLGSVSREIGGPTATDPEDERHWVKGHFAISVHRQ